MEATMRDAVAIREPLPDAAEGVRRARAAGTDFIGAFWIARNSDGVRWVAAQDEHSACNFVPTWLSLPLSDRQLEGFRDKHLRWHLCPGFRPSVLVRVRGQFNRTWPSAGRALGASIANRIQDIAKLRDGQVRSESGRRILAGRLEGALACVRVGPVLRPAVLLAPASSINPAISSVRACPTLGMSL